MLLTSSTLDLICLAVTARGIADRQTTGMMLCFTLIPKSFQGSVQPTIGSQLSFNPKMYMSRNASMKTGIVRPR